MSDASRQRRRSAEADRVRGGCRRRAGERWQVLVGPPRLPMRVSTSFGPGRAVSSGADEPFDPAAAGSPVPAPRQVFAIGLNYADHAAESGLTKPDAPVVFTKFPSAIAGPVTTVQLPPGSVDWEVELVVVIGKMASRCPARAGLGPRCGPDRRPGPLGARPAAQRPGASVQPGQVAPWLRPNGALRGHGR